VWVPLTIIRIITAIDDTYVMPIEVMGFALLLPSIEGLLFGIVFSQVSAIPSCVRISICPYIIALMQIPCPFLSPLLVLLR
jgi:hypothetical protein